MKSLKFSWYNLVSKYCGRSDLIEELWREIERHYREEHRCYHTLEHLSYMIHKSAEHGNKLDDPDTVLFSIFYHDIIYQTTQGDNEEKSAALATDRLALLNVSTEKISKCRKQIMATRDHPWSDESDTNYLVDFDLAILGENAAQYNDYTKKIRKEYSVYPDAVYHAGRQKILQHFLDMEKIFKTEAFQARYEQQARKNIMMELRMMA